MVTHKDWRGLIRSARNNNAIVAHPACLYAAISARPPQPPVVEYNAAEQEAAYNEFDAHYEGNFIVQLLSDYGAFRY